MFTDEFCCKGCVGTAAGIDDEALLVVRRTPGKPQPKYWLERVPAETVDRVSVRTHISLSGILLGVVAGSCGAMMAYATMTGRITGPGAVVIPLACLAIFVGLALGCRRKKIVFCTRQGRFKWVSGALQFDSARRHARAVQDWCREHHVLCNGHIGDAVDDAG